MLAYPALCCTNIQGRFGTAANGCMVMDGFNSTFEMPVPDAMGAVDLPDDSKGVIAAGVSTVLIPAALKKWW